MYDRCDICAQILHPQSEPLQLDVDRQAWSVDVSGYGQELRASMDPDEQEACQEDHQCYGLGVETPKVLFEQPYEQGRGENDGPLWTHSPTSVVVVR